MNIKNLFLTIALSTTSLVSFSKDVLFQGFVSDGNNNGLVHKANIKILDHDTKNLELEFESERDGSFSVSIPRNRKYIVITSKANFITQEEIISTIDLKEDEKVFSKIVMERKPGYVFDVTLTESRENIETMINSIDSARIEVYNNTTQEEELALLHYPSSVFKFVFEPGNHYTIMIRKKGFFNKRIQAYVNVEDCILCFDGLGQVEPGVVDLMLSSKGNSLGYFLANIEMEPIEINNTYEIENIYYEFDKAVIKPEAAVELDKLAELLQDNQQIIVELGAHSDARGNDDYNLTLSEKRASAAVEYLIAKEGISADRLVSKGYGEKQLVNRCYNNVNCTEREHQRNRRTELKIIGTIDIDPLDKKSLKEIIEEGITDDEINNVEK